MLRKARTTLIIVLKSPWFWILLSGYILRLFVMPLTADHDAMRLPWIAHAINLGNLDIYNYFYDKFGEIVLAPQDIWTPYPSGLYFFTAGWLEVLERFNLVDLVSWDVIWQVAQPARYLFLFKAAYLPFDLAIAYLLFRTSGPLGAGLWAWSPVALYGPYMLGQPDIYPVAFACAGAFFAAKSVRHVAANRADSSLLPNKWAILMSISLALGSVFSIFPIFLLLPLTFIADTAWRRRVILLVIGIALPLLASLPFISSRAYTDAVLYALYNNQGLFREVQLFGVTVSPFLVGYLALMAYLVLLDKRTSHRPAAAWYVSILVIATLLLWTPIQMPWLVWLTPFLIAAVESDRKLLISWLMLQFAFVLLLLNQEATLGIALPSRLSDAFQLPNLPTTIDALQPTVYRAYGLLLPFVNILLIAGLLLAAWSSAVALVKEARSTRRPMAMDWWLFLPGLALFLGLAASLFLARDLVGTPGPAGSNELVLSAGDQVVQALVSEQPEITGARLGIAQVSEPTTLVLCLYPAGEMGQEALPCATRDVAEGVEDDPLYFAFGKTIANEGAEPLVTRIQVASESGQVTLRYKGSAAGTLQHDEATLDGALDLSPLIPFSVGDAFDALVVQNVLQDSRLLLVIGFYAVVVTLFAGALAYQTQRAAPQPG
jgi:hypothetical protein